MFLCREDVVSLLQATATCPFICLHHEGCFGFLICFSFPKCNINQKLKQSDLHFNPRIGGLSGGGSGKENFTTYSLGFLISSTG